MKKIICALLLMLILPVLASCGCVTSCLAPRETSKQLTTYYTESPVIAARFYMRGNDDYTLVELPADKLEAFCETLNSMKLKSHAFHTDYYWGGQFGIELEFEDGTFETYDGTRIELRSVSREKNTGSDDTIRSGFIEVTNCKFWEEIQPFFPEEDFTYLAMW